jgi:L-ascorbate oxidase
MTPPRTAVLWDCIALVLLIAFAIADLLCASTAASQSTDSGSIVEPHVFASTGGVLDLLVVAKAKVVPTISFQPPGGGAPIHPTGWVYEICRRSSAEDNTCPEGAATVADYGGARLALHQGDVLKIRLVNRLPAMEPEKVKHGKEVGQSNLFRNPTNLHTHGLIVAPRAPTPNDPTFGDYVFVQVYNPLNGTPDPHVAHQHGLNMMDFVDYRIDIPRDHPSGIYWFHPHVHGISLNQVSSGLAGIITVGDIHDYVRNAPDIVRHLILKDMQVLAAGTLHYAYDKNAVGVVDGEVQNQQIADFCEAGDNGGPTLRHGYCDGEPDSTGTGNDFVNSRWYFTINGQVFPTIRVTAQKGEIWRLINASAEVSYHIQLVDDSTAKPILMQLVAIDGVSISVPHGTSAGTSMAVGGNKFVATDCPSGDPNFLPVCVSDLVMMPGSRAEVWVTYRNVRGSVALPPPDATATLEQIKVPLGRGAEAWPQLKLARIEFAQSKFTQTAVDVGGGKMVASSPTVNAAAPAIMVPGAATVCKALEPGHHRRIFLGVVDPKDSNSPFGFGYEEVVDQTGAVAPGTQVPITAFDPAQSLICLPLGHRGTTVHEVWELINLSTETHNFHIHQTKFTVLDVAAMKQQPQQPSPTGILEDNIPVPFGVPHISVVDEKQNGYCTIEQWHASQCTATPIVLDVPFSQAGEFVFHCHILEHEDSGMMAKIQVVAGRD